LVAVVYLHKHLVTRGDLNMKNTIPDQLSQLFTLGEDMALGCHSHEVTLGLKQNNELSVRADLSALLTGENSFQAARTGKLNAVQAQAAADKEAIKLIVAVRNRLKTFLGSKPSQMWAEVGFPDNSLAVPDTMPKRQAMLLTMNTFLTAHPLYEADQVGVTADECETRRAALASARATVNACRGDVGTKRATRDAKRKQFHKRARGLVTELKQLMPGDDARWRNFGLNPPDAVGLPDVPENVTVTPGVPEHLFVNFEGVGDRFRVYVKIMGVDSDYVLKKTITDKESDLNTFTTGQVVRVRVSAVNDAGESLLSEPVEQTVP
jgi:hypothetical protein